MADENEPAEFEVKGRKYVLLQVDSLTFREAREVRSMSGMTSNELVVALAQSDAVAWHALIMVSMRRVNPRIPDDILDELDFLGFIDQFFGEDDEDEDVPLESDASNDPESDASESDDSSSESPVDDGNPPGPDSSASAPGK